MTAPLGIIAVLWSILVLSTGALMAQDSGDGDKSAKAPVVDLGNQGWTQPLIGSGVKTNDVYTDGNLFLVVPAWSTIGKDGTLGGDYLFLEPYSSLGEQGEIATSLGLGWRHLFSDEPMSALQKQGEARFMEEGWFVGGNVFVDMLDTQHNNNFWQMGVGAEVGTRYLELRGNYYIPMTGQKLYERDVNTQSFSSSSTSLSTQDTYGNPLASGNSIVQPFSSQTLATTTTATTTVRTVTELFEKGMQGWDAEASVLVPWVDQWMDLRISGGYLGFNNQPFGPQNGPTGPVHGWKAGAELRPVPAVVLGGDWYEDTRFTGSNWIVSVELQIPLDKTWKDAFRMRRRHLVEHLAEPVHRQNDAIKMGNEENQQSSSSTSVARVTKVVSQTATNLVLKDDVIFVNNGGPVGNGIHAGSVTGNGTAQHPVNTVQAGANLAVADNLSTNRVWNVYTQQSSVGPYAENVTINGSTNFISSGILIPTVDGKTFGAGVKPTVMGTFATNGAGPFGFVGISGYQIQSASSSPAIELHNVNAVQIVSNYISNPNGAGIQVSAVKGNVSTASIIGNIITQTTLCGCFDAVEVGAFGPKSSLTVVLSGNQITDTEGSGVNAAVIAGGTLNFTATGNLVSGAGVDGMTFTAAGSKSFLNASLSGNTITGSTGDGLNIAVTGLAHARLNLVSNTLSGNGGDGLFLIMDQGAQGKITAAGNNFTGNGGNGATIVTNAEGHLVGDFTGNHFDGNQRTGLFTYADGNSGFVLQSGGDTFSGNQGQGIHIESHDGANLFASTISGATIADNGDSALAVLTDSQAGVQLSVEDSVISAQAPVAIEAVALGKGGGPAVNLFLDFIDDTITATGKGATGIEFTSPDHAVGVLVLEGTSLTVTSPMATGISLVSAGTSSAGPSIGAQIFDSTITVSGGLSTAISVDAHEKSGISLDVENSQINSDGDGIVVSAKNSAFVGVGVGVTAGNTFNVAGQNISLTSQNTAYISASVTGNTMNFGTAGVMLTEGPGATLDATVTGNTITLSDPTGKGIYFDEGGLTQTLTLDGNVILGASDGITLKRHGSGALVADISGNTVGGSSDNGISIISNGSDFSASLVGNSIISSGNNGLAITGSGGHLDAVINGNDIEDSVNNGITITSNGTVTVNAAPTVLGDNTIVTNGVHTLKTNNKASGSIMINGQTVTLPATLGPVFP